MRHLKGLLPFPLVIAACSGSQSSDTLASSDGAATPEPSSTAAGASGRNEDPPKAFVDAHNHYRASHCAPPLEWSTDIARTAQAWANELARSGCKLKHSKSSLGENLAAGTTGTIPPERAVELWYGESKGYDYSKTTFTMGAGHFTQVVWKGSRHVGCGSATCNDKTIWVCNYDPAGNMQGDFATNVDRPTCKK